MPRLTAAGSAERADWCRSGIRQNSEIVPLRTQSPQAGRLLAEIGILANSATNTVSSMASPEPRNPFYLLLLITSLAFIVTALAYAIVPVLEQKARDMGQDPPPSPFRDSLRVDGWKWLLVEVAIMVVFVSVVMLGWEMLYLFKVFPLHLAPR